MQTGQDVDKNEVFVSVFLTPACLTCFTFYLVMLPSSPVFLLNSLFSFFTLLPFQPDPTLLSDLILTISALLSVSWSPLHIYCLASFLSCLSCPESLSPFVHFRHSQSFLFLLCVPHSCHTEIHLAPLFMSHLINLMFPSSLLFSSRVFNLSLSLSSSIIYLHNYPAVTV